MGINCKGLAQFIQKAFNRHQDSKICHNLQRLSIIYARGIQRMGFTHFSILVNSIGSKIANAKRYHHFLTANSNQYYKDQFNILASTNRYSIFLRKLLSPNTCANLCRLGILNKLYRQDWSHYSNSYCTGSYCYVAHTLN